MNTLTDLSRVRRLLCVGAHSDDIEVGCGATVLRLLRETSEVDVTWVVFCGDATRATEAREAAKQITERAASVNVVVHGFRDAHLPGDWLGVKKAMGDLRKTNPDLVFTHRVDDLHQDHRLLGELAGQTFRDHLVLSYEIPKFDGDLGRPGLYAPCSEDDLEAKIRACDAFASQRGKQWFDDDTFRGLARLRGLECNSPTRYAEAFYCRKWMI